MLRFARSFAARTAGATVALDRLQQCITPHVCSDLRLNGFAVVDGVFGDAAAAALRLEIAALRPHMHDNCTHLVASSGSRLLVAKKDIKEAELSMQTTQALAPLCTLLQHDATLCTMLSINMPELALDTQAIKLQWNSGGGGCFPMHFDTDAAVDSRLITAIWYLNPDWKPSDGGQLRLYPFPQARPVDIAPLNDRMVLFSSQRMLHRVLPSAVDRACFTIWLSQGAMARGAGRGVDQSRQQLMETERVAARQALASSEPLGAEEAWRVLCLEEIRKHAAKWYYRDEWGRSIEESHPEGAERAALVEGFWKEVGMIGRALAPVLPALQAWNGAASERETRVQWFH